MDVRAPCVDKTSGEPQGERHRTRTALSLSTMSVLDPELIAEPSCKVSQSFSKFLWPRFVASAPTVAKLTSRADSPSESMGQGGP